MHGKSGIKNQRLHAKFLKDNRLKLNDDKTTLLVLDRGGSKYKYEEERKVEIITPSLAIKPSQTQKLLGCCIHENLKWTDHLITNEKSLVKGSTVSRNTREDTHTLHSSMAFQIALKPLFL